jgi:hypothetical protein
VGLRTHPILRLEVLKVAFLASWVDLYPVGCGGEQEGKEGEDEERAKAKHGDEANGGAGRYTDEPAVREMGMRMWLCVPCAGRCWAAVWPLFAGQRLLLLTNGETRQRSH